MAVDMTLTLDTKNMAPAVHSMLPFNSFCEMAGTLYATGALGIYELTGDTDVGEEITAGVLWRGMSFGVSNKKKFRKIMLSGDVTNSSLQLVTESGTSDVYAIKNNRFSIGRNMIGRNWSLRLSGFDKLESVELFPIILGQ